MLLWCLEWGIQVSLHPQHEETYLKFFWPQFDFHVSSFVYIFQRKLTQVEYGSEGEWYVFCGAHSHNSKWLTPTGNTHLFATSLCDLRDDIEYPLTAPAAMALQASAPWTAIMAHFKMQKMIHLS